VYAEQLNTVATVAAKKGVDAHYYVAKVGLTDDMHLHPEYSGKPHLSADVASLLAMSYPFQPHFCAFLSDYNASWYEIFRGRWWKTKRKSKTPSKTPSTVPEFNNSF
jgi:hypothetical protein